MNSKKQAQKGFKTFILTLAISLAVFSGIYYIINVEDDSPVMKTTSEDESTNVLDARVAETANNNEETLGEKSERPEEESVFADLAVAKSVGVGEEDTDETGAVLAGADVGETTESTVPDTGIS